VNLLPVLRRIACALVLTIAVVLPTVAEAQQATTGDASAQTGQVKIDPKKLLGQPRTSQARGALVIPSFWDDPTGYLRARQQSAYEQLSGTLKALRGDNATAAIWTLVLLSLGYGVFHAAGPGHGKIVISGWLVATEQQLRRGVLVSFLSALVQALSAILLVTAILFVLNAASTAARVTSEIMESASYGLIALLGVYLIATSVQTIGRRRQSAMLVCDHEGDHRHHCRGPEARDLDRDWSMSKALSIAVAVGIRPCTGAILVLLFAAAARIYWAGILATFLMALGTAVTVSLIACVAVLSKRLALRLAHHDDRWLTATEIALRFGGGVVIVVLGTVLFIGSLSQSSGFV
jgi:ABC-type nickel/cobalt efflux system permease component RcnA